MNHPPILLGTSSFTAAGWQGSFYPRGMKPSDYLAFYAERFHTVEVESTFYACPTPRTVENWNARRPEGFIFSVKVPQTITHDKVLVDCDAEPCHHKRTDLTNTSLNAGLPSRTQRSSQNLSYLSPWTPALFYS